MMIKYLKDKYKDQNFESFFASGRDVDYVNKEGRICKRVLLPDGKHKFYCGMIKKIGEVEAKCDNLPGPSC
jgi:hypothetical protein